MTVLDSYPTPTTTTDMWPAHGGGGEEGKTYLPRLPESFRLADRNPISGQPYAQSRYEVLPPYAVAVVGMTACAWNALVSAGAVDTVFSLTRVYPLTAALEEARGWQWLVASGTATLGRAAEAGLCPECLGTLIAHDFDASITGHRDAPYVCGCATLPGSVSCW